MNLEELKSKTVNAFKALSYEKKYVAPVEIFLKLEILSKKDYEDWRMGRIPYLEKAIKINLSKINLVMKELKKYASGNGFRESFSVYKKWGKGKSSDLRFSKNGVEEIERSYSTHFVGPKISEDVKSDVSEIDTIE